MVEEGKKETAAEQPSSSNLGTGQLAIHSESISTTTARALRLICRPSSSTARFPYRSSSQVPNARFVEALRRNQALSPPLQPLVQLPPAHRKETLSGKLPYLRVSSVPPDCARDGRGAPHSSVLLSGAGESPFRSSSVSLACPRRYTLQLIRSPLSTLNHGAPARSLFYALTHANDASEANSDGRFVSWPRRRTRYNTTMESAGSTLTLIRSTWSAPVRSNISRAAASWVGASTLSTLLLR